MSFLHLGRYNWKPTSISTFFLISKAFGFHKEEMFTCKLNLIKLLRSNHQSLDLKYMEVTYIAIIPFFYNLLFKWSSASEKQQQKVNHLLIHYR
jgi:hypothetical protein